MFEEKANPQAIDTLGDFFIGGMNIEHLKDEHRTLKRRTSNIEHPTSNFEWERMKKQN